MSDSFPLNKTKLSKDMLKNVSKEQANIFLQEIGIDPNEIENSNLLRAYYLNIINHLISYGKLQDYIKVMKDDGLIFAKKWWEEINQNTNDNQVPKKPETPKSEDTNEKKNSKLIIGGLTCLLIFLVPVYIMYSNSQIKLITSEYKQLQREISNEDNSIAIKKLREFSTKYPGNSYEPAIVEKISCLKEEIKSKVRYKALIIANKNYQQPLWQGLVTPIQDAKDLQKVLVEKYGLDQKEDIMFIQDANKQRMIDALSNDLLDNITRDHSVLIFYSGHGAIHNKEAYWVPIDATNETSTYIEGFAVKKYLLDIAAIAKHTLLISDSCFSGRLVRASKSINIEKERDYFEKRYLKRSCQVITSAINEADDRYRKTPNSPFARVLIRALENKEQKIYSASEIGLYIEKYIESEQIPGYTRIKEVKEKGEFFFIRSRGLKKSVANAQLENVNIIQENFKKEVEFYQKIKIKASSFFIKVDNHDEYKVNGINALLFASGKNNWYITNYSKITQEFKDGALNIFLSDNTCSLEVWADDLPDGFSFIVEGGGNDIRRMFRMYAESVYLKNPRNVRVQIYLK